MDVLDRFQEQLSTTAETLRRRFVAYGDGVLAIGTKGAGALERIRDVAEPACLDLADYSTAAVQQTEPLASLDTDTKNTLVEMYLGISVLLLGLSCGQLCGAFAIGSLLEMTFDLSIEFTLAVLLPVYIWLHMRKNAALDDVERRTSLFFLSLSWGALLGHLSGPSVASLAPSTLFLTPLLYALAWDNELLPTPLSSLDRHSFFYAAASASTFICAFFGVIALGYFSLACLTLSAIHSAFLSFHIQIVLQRCKEKTHNIAESQFAYVVALAIIQLFVTSIIGSHPYSAVVSEVSS